MPENHRNIELSIVSPAHDERENVEPLVKEIVAAMEPTGVRYEILIIDDGSKDGTTEVLQDLLGRFNVLRALRMADTPPGRGHGQSAAFSAGFAASAGALIAVLDADLQNNPADIPAMLELMRSSGADMIQGDRSANRNDNVVRRATSLVGRTTRRWLLNDTIRDTGCSLRLMRRDVALAIPLQYRGMHRFIPITARQLGYEVVEMPVSHRARVAGEAKYGILNRAVPGFIDCLAVRWMANRRRPTTATPLGTTAIAPNASAASSPAPSKATA